MVHQSLTTSRRRLLLAGGASAALAACSGLPLPGRLSLREAPELAAEAPAAPREFRAAWVATVANIDWPSKPGLSLAQQQAEMRAMLDQAVALKLNAIVLQVRTSADALYPSTLEPWSEYLSGSQGQDPGYDPLALWIGEAHARGLELHAWFNPFRARPSTAKSVPAATHLSQTRPDWVKRYGDQLWIDPGETEAAEHTLAVFADVLRRYEVDGIHIDDYFYPYPVQEPGSKTEVDFPDEPAWQRYLQGGGTLARADWRRCNVDELVRRIHAQIRTIKPWVRFGVSPFGLGKPGQRPAGISGFSQYDKLYANVELWLEQGWMDYLAPQLYWPRAQTAQAFAPLLDYWRGQNPQGRHVWPGLFTSRITDKPESWPVEEIEAQIEIVRDKAPGSGHLHFSMIALAQNRRGVADALKARAYVEPALVPATPWLEEGSPGLPRVQARVENQVLHLELQPGDAGKPVARYAVWLRRLGRWEFHAPAAASLQVAREGVDAIVATALDRVGTEGPRLALTLAG